jgi:hypothetical protein
MKNSLTPAPVMIEVTQEDGSDFCRILTALGMEEEGDVVAEVERLRDAEQWQPMVTAPKDGTLVLLMVEFEDHATEDGEGPFPTIGSNTWDNHHDFDEWQFAGWSWTQDCFTQGVGRPVLWKPIHPGIKAYAQAKQPS